MYYLSEKFRAFAVRFTTPADADNQIPVFYLWLLVDNILSIILSSSHVPKTVYGSVTCQF